MSGRGRGRGRRRLSRRSREQAQIQSLRQELRTANTGAFSKRTSCVQLPPYQWHSQMTIPGHSTSSTGGVMTPRVLKPYTTSTGMLPYVDGGSPQIPLKAVCCRHLSTWLYMEDKAIKRLPMAPTAPLETLTPSLLGALRTCPNHDVKLIHRLVYAVLTYVVMYS